jgi:hypothetical protein
MRCRIASSVIFVAGPVFFIVPQRNAFAAFTSRFSSKGIRRSGLFLSHPIQGDPSAPNLYVCLVHPLGSVYRAIGIGPSGFRIPQITLTHPRIVGGVSMMPLDSFVYRIHRRYSGEPQVSAPGGRRSKPDWLLWADSGCAAAATSGSAADFKCAPPICASCQRRCTGVDTAAGSAHP